MVNICDKKKRLMLYILQYFDVAHIYIYTYNDICHFWRKSFFCKCATHMVGVNGDFIF